MFPCRVVRNHTSVGPTSVFSVLTILHKPSFLSYYVQSNDRLMPSPSCLLLLYTHSQIDSTMVSTRSETDLPGDPPRSPYPFFRHLRELVALLAPGEEEIIEEVPSQWAAQLIESVESQGTRKENCLRFSPCMSKSSLRWLNTVGRLTIRRHVPS